MILHTCLPEGLAGVPAGHGELQRVLAQLLCARDRTVSVRGIGQTLPLALLNPQGSYGLPVAPGSALSPRWGHRSSTRHTQGEGTSPVSSRNGFYSKLGIPCG